MTLIIFAVAISIIGALAYAVHRQHQSIKTLHEHRLHLLQEVEHLRGQLGAVTTVIKCSGGGVAKRIREHEEIVSAITNHQPTLFEDEPGLRHWLGADDEFFEALASAGAYNCT